MIPGFAKDRERACLRFGRVFAALIPILGWAAQDSASAFKGTLQADRDFTFGIVAGTHASAGTIKLDAATGSVTMTGGVTFFGGATQTAKFSGQGHGTIQHCTVTLIFPESVPVSSGGNTATLSNFTLSPPTVTLSGPRRFSFEVGATLNVPRGLPAGSYTGDVTATAITTDC